MLKEPQAKQVIQELKEPQVHRDQQDPEVLKVLKEVVDQ